TEKNRQHRTDGCRPGCERQYRQTDYDRQIIIGLTAYKHRSSEHKEPHHNAKQYTGESLLADNAEDMTGLNLTHGQRTNEGGDCLRAYISTGADEDGDEYGQQCDLGKNVLIMRLD